MRLLEMSFSGTVFILAVVMNTAAAGHYMTVKS